MIPVTTILCAHGVGDAILGMQCAHYVKTRVPLVVACCRDEVFKILREAFGFSIVQHPEKEKWGENNWILNNQAELQNHRETQGEVEVYYVIPDLLFRNPLTFDWRKYNVSPQTIKSTRVLTHHWKPSKRIYVGLASSHPDYQFRNIYALLFALGANFPEYEIYYPNLQNWNGSKMPGEPVDFSGLPANVVIDTVCAVETTVKKLKESDYGIFVDNGFSHLAYQCGVPRLVLDHYYGNCAFESRWRENTEDYIPYTEKIEEILPIIYNGLNDPTTLLINKNWLRNRSTDWSKALIYKY